MLEDGMKLGDEAIAVEEAVLKEEESFL